MLDADISDFFTKLDQSWLLKFIEHRVADKRVLRLIQKWLRAGVIEDGAWTASDEGSPQGASVSPLLANVYLHYVLDLWAQQWRRRHAHGEMIIVRYGDDFVAGFEHRSDAERFHSELRERFASFALELHPEKTRLIEFGRFAAQQPSSAGPRASRRRRVRPGRGAGVAAGPFPRPALRTGLAHSCASGSPQDMRWPIRDAGVRQRRPLAGWWPVLWQWSSPTARGCGGRDSDIGSPEPRRAMRASCLRGWSSFAPNIVA